MTELSVRSILVASDLQPNTDDAIASAADLAIRLGAELHVLHAMDLGSSAYPFFGVAMDLQRRMHDSRHALRGQLERALPAGYTPASQQVVADSAQAAIILRATEVGADLIVLGPHRPRLFHGPILGTTSDRVIRSADVPILILHERVRLPLTRVVIPIDLSDPARGALDQGLLWARHLGEAEPQDVPGPTTASVLHVVPRLYEAYDFPFDRAVIAPELNREIGDALTRIGGTGAVAVREEVVWGNSPGEEIIREVEKGKADLLVMGTHGYGALGRALIGSITSTVARSAPCPILLIPPGLWTVDTPASAIPIEVELAEPTLQSG